MTRDERAPVVEILLAHARTVTVCEACATTTPRDLGEEVRRGGKPSREDLRQTIEEAASVLTELGAVRAEIERLLGRLC